MRISISLSRETFATFPYWMAKHFFDSCLARDFKALREKNKLFNLHAHFSFIYFFSENYLKLIEFSVFFFLEGLIFLPNFSLSL